MSDGGLLTVATVAPNDVWAGGDALLQHFDGTQWRDVSRRSAACTKGWRRSRRRTCGWAAGGVAHWDGAAWQSVTARQMGFVGCRERAVRRGERPVAQRRLGRRNTRRERRHEHPSDRPLGRRPPGGRPSTRSCCSRLEPTVPERTGAAAPHWDGGAQAPFHVPAASPLCSRLAGPVRGRIATARGSSSWARRPAVCVPLCRRSV